MHEKKMELKYYFRKLNNNYYYFWSDFCPEHCSVVGMIATITVDYWCSMNSIISLFYMTASIFLILWCDSIIYYIFELVWRWCDLQLDWGQMRRSASIYNTCGVQVNALDFYFKLLSSPDPDFIMNTNRNIAYYTVIFLLLYFVFSYLYVYTLVLFSLRFKTGKDS